MHNASACLLTNPHNEPMHNAEQVESGTTSHGAGGLWKPYTLGGCC